jgi:hypothetical protein
MFYLKEIIVLISKWKRINAVIINVYNSPLVEREAPLFNHLFREYFRIPNIELIILNFNILNQSIDQLNSVLNCHQLFCLSACSESLDLTF